MSRAVASHRKSRDAHWLQNVRVGPVSPSSSRNKLIGGLVTLVVMLSVAVAILAARPSVAGTTTKETPTIKVETREVLPEVCQDFIRASDALLLFTTDYISTHALSMDGILAGDLDTLNETVTQMEALSIRLDKVSIRYENSRKGCLDSV